MQREPPARLARLAVWRKESMIQGHARPASPHGGCGIRVHTRCRRRALGDRYRWQRKPSQRFSLHGVDNAAAGRRTEKADHGTVGCGDDLGCRLVVGASNAPWLLTVRAACFPRYRVGRIVTTGAAKAGWASIRNRPVTRPVDRAVVRSQQQRRSDRSVLAQIRRRFLNGKLNVDHWI
jgi:hypothetical protein